MAKQSEKPKEENQDPIENIETVEECFIITPIGAFGSEVYNKAMGLIDAVIDPVLRERRMMAMPANRMPDLGSINKQLVKRVIEDRLVIANLTGLNANVMYELAVRHAARKPVIIMAEEGTRLPFDITDQRTIFYADTLSGVEFAKAELRKKIGFALNDENPDNPIYAYLENAELFKKVADSDFNQSVLNMLVSLNEKVSSVNNIKSRDNSTNSNYGRINITPGSPWIDRETIYRNFLVILSSSFETPNLTDLVMNQMHRVLVSYFGTKSAPKLMLTRNGITFEIPDFANDTLIKEIVIAIKNLEGVDEVILTPF